MDNLIYNKSTSYLGNSSNSSLGLVELRLLICPGNPWKMPWKQSETQPLVPMPLTYVLGWNLGNSDFSSSLHPYFLGDLLTFLFSLFTWNSAFGGTFLGKPMRQTYFWTYFTLLLGRDTPPHTYFFGNSPGNLCIWPPPCDLKLLLLLPIKPLGATHKNTPWELKLHTHSVPYNNISLGHQTGFYSI